MKEIPFSPTLNSNAVIQQASSTVVNGKAIDWSVEFHGMNYLYIFTSSANCMKNNVKI